MVLGEKNMPNLKITSLIISGYAGKTVPNRFFRQEGAVQTLAVLFPGLNYSCDMPLLFYPLKLLLARGAEVLQVRADYSVQEYRALPPEERAAWLAADARAVVQAARFQGEYPRLVLVGKSIGTIALASLVPLAPQAVTIWLTPLLRDSLVTKAAEQNRGAALFVAGTADDLYDAAALKRIQAATQAEAELIEGGNHSLEIEGDFFASLRALEQTMRAVAGFLGRQDV
jgi:predicted alpha/beta-hydrolase family hydrolase